MLRKKIGDLLIDKGLITAEDLTRALEEQKNSGSKLGEILVGEGLITEEQLIETIAERLKVPKISISSLVIDPRVISAVPVEIARRYTLIPVFKIGDVLTVAMADPLNIIAIDELKYISKCEIKRVIALEREIETAIDEYYSVADSMNEVIGGYDERPAEAEPVEPKTAMGGASDAPVVKLVDLILSRAVKDKASDIHIEPDESHLRIRYRVNGIMKEEASPPKSLQAELISRIKVAANMDVSEKRLPQDGRMLIRVDDNDIDLRVSTLPTINGEKIVIRILDKRVIKIGLGELGFNDRLLNDWHNIINRKEGIVLITGPTSSGKTTTLYASLQKINSIEKNIITVEDPVEYSIPMINQVQVNEKAGLNFANLLRSILRQNPDVIMVGEIRDTETAMMAMRAAITGHLVFSTLHTNDAPSSITRLIDMGIERYLVASAVKGVLAQRLVRTNCPHCLEEYKPDPINLQMAERATSFENVSFKRGSGCNKCRMTGYKGQTGIFELIPIDGTLYEMIIAGESESKIKAHASELGYIPIFRAGMEKVKNGEVALEELIRVISIGEQTTAIGTSGQTLERINV